MSNQGFSALLLNLDRDVARRDHMERQLARANIAFTRLSGILGDAVPDDLRGFFFEPNGQPKTIMKRGEIGCYASHLRALTNIAAGVYGNTVLVMEDDLNIAADLTSIIADACRAMPPDWDILRLSCPPRRAYAPLARLSNGCYLAQYSKIPNSAGAYLVTSKGAQKFLDHGIRGLTFDDDLRRPWFHRMNTYGVVLAPVKAGVLASTIDAVEAGRFDKGLSSRMERIKRGDHAYALKRLTYNIGTMGPARWMACALINIVDMLAKPLLKRSLIDDAAHLFPVIKR